MKYKPLSIFAKIALWIGIAVCGFSTVMSTIMLMVFLVQVFDPAFAGPNGSDNLAANIIAFLVSLLLVLLFGWLTVIQNRRLKAAQLQPPLWQRPNPFVCVSCGMDAHTLDVNLNRHFGAVILMFHRSVKGRFCRPCVSRTFWNWTPLTFFLGWWGFISFVITPIVLINNLVMYIRSLFLPAGQGTRLVFGDAEIATVSSLSMDIADRLNSGEDAESLAKEIAASSGLTPGQAYVYMQFRLTQAREPAPSLARQPALVDSAV